MKKLIISVLCFCCILGFSYSESIISLSLAPDVGTTNFSNSIEDFKLFDANIKFNADYKYLTPIGITFGAQIGLQPDIIIFGSTSLSSAGITLSHAGFGINFAPIIGYRFGKKHLLGIEVLPVSFLYSRFDGNGKATRSSGRSTTEYDIPFSGNKYVLSTEVRANIQFGNKFARNGFIAGIGFPWYINLTDLKINKTTTSGNFSCRGVYIEVGYKISFVM